MGLFYLLDGKIMIEDLEEIWREMSEKKRVPPWERAQLSFTLAERRRLRKVEENERPGKARLLDLEEKLHPRRPIGEGGTEDRRRTRLLQMCKK